MFTTSQPRLVRHLWVLNSMKYKSEKKFDILLQHNARKCECRKWYSFKCGFYVKTKNYAPKHKVKCWRLWYRNKLSHPLDWLHDGHRVKTALKLLQVIENIIMYIVTKALIFIHIHNRTNTQKNINYHPPKNSMHYN